MPAKSTENAKKTYNDQNIKALKGEARVRERPAVIFGSDGPDDGHGRGDQL